MITKELIILLYIIIREYNLINYHNKSSVNGCFANSAPSNENNTSIVDDVELLKTIGKKFTIL